MEARHLLLLRELADRGSVAATAAALFVSPSAISQQLRSAEAELGVPLVEPAGRGIRLTRAGRVLAESGVEVARALAVAERSLAEHRGAHERTVGLVSLPSAAEVILPDVLARIGPSGVQLRVDDQDVSEAAFGRLARDQDLVVGHRMGRPDPDWQGLLRHDLYREPLDIAVPADHRLATRPAVSAADIAGERWIGVPACFPFDELRISVEAAAGQTFEVVQRVRDNRLVEALVAGGHGMGLLPRFSTRRRPEVVLLPLHGVPTGRTISALVRPDVAERWAVRVVLDALIEAGSAVG